jgi:hypothetical protein
LVPRHEFDSLGKVHDGKRRRDALPWWSQFVALVTGHIGEHKTLRDIIQIMAALCICLILAWMKFTFSIKHSLMHILRLLQLNLFSYWKTVGIVETTRTKTENCSQLTAGFMNQNKWDSNGLLPFCEQHSNAL